MAISAISSRHAGFTFGGESSKTYGVYIADGGFYSAPIRDTEVVEIPGRNGAYILDRGRFKNIQVTYKAFMGAERKEDFISGISAVRNWLCSKKGYVRLTDDFNPDEYRLATFSNGLEVSNLNPKTGEFDITFECMPQRFLAQGETAQTVTNGGTISNPTLFNSRPMLEATGFGKIGINGSEIQIVSEPIGRVQILPNYDEILPGSGSTTFTAVSPNYQSLRLGDTARIDGGRIAASLNGTIRNISGFTQSGDLVKHTPTGYGTSTLTFPFNASYTYQYGTAQSASAYVEVITGTDTENASSMTLYSLTLNMSIDANGIITVEMSGLSSPLRYTLFIGGIIAMSTKTSIGEPLYIDLDIGEAWKIEDNAKIGVNTAIIIGPELPVLIPGENIITFDPTVVDLKIIPRWWKV